MTAAAPLRVSVAPVQVRLASPAELAQWDQLVRRFEHCRVYHEAAWLRSIEQTSGARLVRLIFERGGEVVGCLPGFMRRLGPLNLFGSPFEGTQTESLGPLFDPARITSAQLLDTLLVFLERELGVHHIEIVARNLDGAEMRSRGFEGQTIFTYLANLFPGDENQTLASWKGNARNHLRKAQKLGLTVREETGEEFARECYSQMQEVFTRRGNAIPFSEQRLVACFRAMRDSGNVIALSVWAPDDPECAATGMYLADGREMILWCWTHRTRFRPQCPTELLTWAAMQKGMERGCTQLDMTGGGDAKPKFGGEPDESTVRWIRSRYRWISGARRFAKRVYRWQQSLRGRWARQRGKSAEA